MNINDLTFVATQAALKAGEILRKGFGSPYKITAKPGYQGRQNIVTDYDKASEKTIIDLIHEYFPTHSILSEECGFIENKGSILWIIDPLDGTTNFARNIPIFTISIAAYEGEKGHCGVIYQPLTNELFVTQKGKGSYLNGNRLSVSSTQTLNDALIGGGFPYNITEKPIPYLTHFNHFTRLGATVRHIGSAALSLAYVSAGKFDGFWLDHLNPWDLAAGKLLVEEAGGLVTQYSGILHRINEPSNILSTNQLIHTEMLTYLKQ